MIKIYQFKGANYGIGVDNKLYLFDGGYDTDPMDNFNLYKGLGYSEIEAIFLSHYHDHHIGGVPGLITNFEGKIKTIYTSGIRPPLTGDWAYEWGKTEEMESLIEQYNINYQFLSAGDIIPDTESAKIYVLNPSRTLFPEVPSNVTSNPNDWSMLIILVVYGKFSALFTGDATAAVGGVGNQDFWKQYIFPQIQQILGTTKVTVVQTPHHGDDTVAYDWFFDPLAPDLVLMDHSEAFTLDMRTYLQTKGIKYYSRHPLPDAHIGGQLAITGLKDGSYTFPDAKRIPQTIYLKNNNILRTVTGIKQMNGMLRDKTSMEIRF